MPMVAFKKHLESYVQAPSPYFKLCSDNIVQGDTDTTDGIYITSLEQVEEDATLHVRLDRPSKSGIKTTVLHLKLDSIKVDMNLEVFYYCARSLYWCRRLR